MKITFTKLCFENFMSLGKGELTLNFPGYSFIKGVNNSITDNAASNGAGKTALLEAINWALTGETIRGSKDIVNHASSDGTLVDLSFEIDGTEYRILRSKDHSKYKTTLKVYVNGEDSSAKGLRDTQKKLEELLPDLNYSLIGSVIILGQGLPQRFTNNTPSGRKEVLEKLSQSDFMIASLKDRIASRKQELSTLLRESEDSLLKLNTEKNIFAESEKNYESQIESLNKVSFEVMKAEVESSKESLEKKKKEKEEIEEKIEKLNAAFVEASEEYSKLDYTLFSIKDEKTADLKKSLSELEKNTLSFESEVSLLEKEIRELDNIKDVCPTCGQKLPNITKVDTTDKKVDLTFKKLRLDELRQASDDIKSKISFIEKSEDILFESKRKKVEDEKSAAHSSIESAKKEKQDIDSKIQMLTTKVTNQQSALDFYKNNLESIKRDLESTRQKLLEIEKSLEEKLLEKEDIQAHLDVINKFNTIVSRDFRGYLLTNVISFIDKRAKEYSKDIFSSDKISFKLDGNNISISYDDKEYECLSGGERQKIDLIVQFSIRDMLCKFLNFSSNILALDELTDNLDSQGTENLFNLISKKLNDVESVYIISHHEDFQIPTDREIIVTKGKDGVSHIEA